MRALPFSALCDKSTIPDKVSKLLCRNSMTHPIHTTHGSPFYSLSLMKIAVVRPTLNSKKFESNLITGEVEKAK